MRAGPLKSSNAEFVALAERLVPLHKTFLALGLRLVIKPDFTTDGAGHVTARFVYRNEHSSITFSARRLQVEWS